MNKFRRQYKRESIERIRLIRARRKGKKLYVGKVYDIYFIKNSLFNNCKLTIKEWSTDSSYEIIQDV